MLHYEIAGLLIDIGNIDDKKKYIKKRMEIFKKQHENKADISINLIDRDYIALPGNNTLLNENSNLNWVEKVGYEKGFYGYKVRMSTGEIVDLLDTDDRWKNAAISILNTDYYSNYEINPIEYIAFNLIGTMFRNRILFHDGIVLHASSIEWRDKGIIFSAPSGTGKSTHVKLWEKFMGDTVSVLNDDSPAIRMIYGHPYIFGTPWSGSSDKFTNNYAPLSAIVMLEQAPENSICSLSTQDAVLRLLPRCFLPYFDRSLMDKAIVVLEMITRNVPIYILKCRPDREAMELVYQCVK